MAFIAVSIPVSSPDDIDVAMAHAVESVEVGADLVEWRIDEWPEEDDSVSELSKLVDDGPAACILTVRSVAEGGAFEGSPDDLAEFILAMAEHGMRPRYLDLEYAMWNASSSLRDAFAAMHDDVGLILSMHDMLGRPADLLRIAVDMQAQEEAAVVKLVWRARSTRDNLEAFELLRTRSKPMIALCMGELGLPSRVLAGRAGGFLTFASSSAGATADGQCDIATLLDRYRFRSLQPETQLFGIIGWPITHSLSPIVHNEGFASEGIDAVLLPLPVLQGWESFKATLSVLLSDPDFNLRGLCVTVPHKIHALRFVREAGGDITDIAERAGAANTIIVGPDGALTADNTDAPAIVETLGFEPSGSRVALLGAGGAARAAIASLVEAGARVDVFNRGDERAATLVEMMDSPMCTLGDLDEVSGYDIVLNTTSVGMADGPDPTGNPAEELGLPGWVIEDAAVVYECVYAPRRTPLIQAAEASGTQVVTGEAMFLAQAIRQFKMWTGCEPSFERWRQLID